MDKKSESQFRKNRCLRFSDEEYELLKKLAASQGCTIAELIRRTVIYDNQISPVIVDMEPIRKILFELSMEGNNLNQIAREVNTYGVSPRLERSIEEELKRHKKVRKKLDGLIRDLRNGELNL